RGWGGGGIQRGSGGGVVPGGPPNPASRRGGKTLLPADRVHWPGWRNEAGAIDLVTFPFSGHGAADLGGDLFVGGAGAHQALDIVFLNGEEAVSQLAVGSHTDAIAVAAERPAHPRDEPHPPSPL